MKLTIGRWGLRIILANRFAFEPRFAYRRAMWSRRGVFVYCRRYLGATGEETG